MALFCVQFGPKLRPKSNWPSPIDGIAPRGLGAKNWPSTIANNYNINSDPKHLLPSTITHSHIAPPNYQLSHSTPFNYQLFAKEPLC